MMAIPYLMSKTGFVVGAVVIVCAFAVSTVLHLMIADMLLVENSGLTIMPIFQRFLFRGKLRHLLTTVFFILLCVVLMANLAAYIAGGGEIIVSLTGWNETFCKAAFYLISIIVPLLGLKAVGLSEKTAVTAMILVVALLALLSLGHTTSPLSLPGRNLVCAPLALYSGVMFCLSALFAIPQAVSGLAANRQQVRRAVTLGLGLNALLTLMVAISAIQASTEVTKVAIIGWSATLGRSVQLLASLFVLLAMLTSFWAIALAQSEMVAAQVSWLRGIRGFVVITLPSLLITFLGGADFLSFISITGGAVAVIVALLLVPAHRNARRESTAPSLLGAAGDRSLLAGVIFLAYLLMAAGSLISI